MILGVFHNVNDVPSQHYLDGGFSSMLPVLPVSCSDILTVCPFSGETDICPRDTNSMLDMVVSGTTLKGNIANTLRILNALYPMALEVSWRCFAVILNIVFSFGFLSKIPNINTPINSL